MPLLPGFMAIAGDLWLNEDYDVAVRDVNMAIAAFALGQLSAIRANRLSEFEPAHRIEKAA
jgi:hypothetical protein